MRAEFNKDRKFEFPRPVGVWNHYTEICGFGTGIEHQHWTMREHHDSLINGWSYAGPMLTNRWIEYFFNIAFVVATQSKDPSTKVGCVLTNMQKQIIATGYNGFPIRMDDNPALYADRDYKLKHVVHAEANAICQCAANQSSTLGATAFITLQPCNECAKLLIQAGISRVFYLKDTAPKKKKIATPNDWRNDPMLGVDMLSDADVRVYECEYITDINGDDILVAKELWKKTDDPNPCDPNLIDKNILDTIINTMYVFQKEALNKPIKNTKRVVETIETAILDLTKDTIINEIRRREENRGPTMHTVRDYTNAAYCMVRAVNNAFDEYLQRFEGYVPELMGITVDVPNVSMDEYYKGEKPKLVLSYNGHEKRYDIGMR